MDMFEIRQTDEYSDWFENLKDDRARAKILVRIDRLQLRLRGDSKSVGETVSELRIDYGSGYRVYYTKRGKLIIFLLAGGDKSSQKRDIKKAQRLAKML